jgi:hypothetical protein
VRNNDRVRFKYVTLRLQVLHKVDIVLNVGLRRSLRQPTLKFIPEGLFRKYCKGIEEKRALDRGTR